MEQTVPLTENETAIVNEIMEMQHDYDNGLREFQDSIHYCIFLICTHVDKKMIPKRTVSTVLYMQDLADRLRRLENLAK